jgi:glutamate-1-semialdehyde 2,1-aminomutase
MVREDALLGRLSAPDTTRSQIVSQYESLTPASATAHRRDVASLAGGTSRQTSYWKPYPLTVVRGEGSRVWDVDGNAYLDLINNFTALIHGHAYPPVTEAISRAVADGVLWSANNVFQAELAEQICARVASVDKVRFCNSGSEASGLGLKIARAATGREKVLMARFGYHGMVAEFEAGSFDRGGPSTLTATFNDLAQFEAVLAQHGADLAAVFLEPMLGAGGVLIGEKAFFDGVARATRAAGALFVLDEVQTFRLAVGGLQQVLDLTPDLTLFGKFIGGGFPAGAVGGREEVMRLFDPDRLGVYHSGTFNGNPISMQAGAITVRDLTAERILHIERLATRLKGRLRAKAQAVGLPFSVNQAGSLMNLFFMSSSPASVFLRTDEDVCRRFHLAALNRGVMFAPRGFLVMSTNMTEDFVDEAAERLGEAMADTLNDLDGASV